MKLVRNMHGMPVEEHPLMSEEEKIDKFLSLRDLKDFLLSSQDDIAANTLKNRSVLSRISGLLSKQNES